MSDTLLKSKVQSQCLAMRPREAALALGVSERTLWTWTAEGKVPFVRLGRTVMYPTDALRRWLQEQAKAPATPATVDATEGGEQ